MKPSNLMIQFHNAMYTMAIAPWKSWLLAVVEGVGTGLMLIGFAIWFCEKANAEPVVPACAADGGDCVQYLQDLGPAAFCDWASTFAALGNHKRQVSDATEVKLVFRRALTPREKATIDYWLGLGWSMSHLQPPQAKATAYQTCMQTKLES